MFESSYFSEDGIELLRAYRDDRRYRLTFDETDHSYADVVVRLWDYNGEEAPLTVIRIWHGRTSSVHSACSHIVLDAENGPVVQTWGRTETASWEKARDRIQAVYGLR
jgi:hypothetical protein